ncbi:3-dehydroecdysone 3alpha-reductase [Operophtera brumata]|uniref:3-dehydroecdysone 3alpha-reductase n=1 Tax=Operophtera brumata TaxID=104452 RepID=A0A0L7KLX4_OPEBR|nr:3-dehydroecdysone 3alpha-reductase [Operophtera brumata]
MSFANKVVIVTGGSSGIGATTALHFAKEGAQVAIVGRNDSKLKNVAARISKIGKKPLIIKADVSKDDEVKTIIKNTVEKFGKLDILVNNAGLIRSAAVVDENFVEIYDEVVNTNLRSIFVLTNLAIPHLIKTKGSSTLRSFAPSGYAAYGVSKAGLNHFSRVSAMELAPKGVRVNVVSPGPVETPIFENTGIDANWEEVINLTALKVVTQTDEIADMILYLASDKAKSITGSNYVNVLLT